MTIQPRQMLVSSSKYSLKCPYSMEAESICVHNTASDASANNEVKYMIGNDNSTGYHFAIDNKEVVQGIPTNRNAFHAGDGGNGMGNRKAIGIEICYSKSGGERYDKAEELAIKFIAQLLHERKWGVDKVVPHKKFSGKHCPHRILDEKRWDSFVNEVKVELDKLNKPKPQTESKQYTQQHQYPSAKVKFEGKTVEALLIDNQVMVQLRDLAKLINCPLNYNSTNKEITFNNVKIKPVIINGLSYLHVREASDIVGLQIKWDQPNHTVILTK